MDHQTQAYLASRLRDLLSAENMLLDSDALVEMRRILSRSQDISPGRIGEAERNFERLTFVAASLATARGAPSLSAEDIREALTSLCPFWPFC
jgi:hypothetical protein